MMRPGIYIYLNRIQLEFLCSRAFETCLPILFRVFVASFKSRSMATAASAAVEEEEWTTLLTGREQTKNGQIVKRFCRPDAPDWISFGISLMCFIIVALRRDDRLGERSTHTWMHVKFNRLELSNLFTASMCQWQSNEVNEANSRRNCLCAVRRTAYTN